MKFREKIWDFRSNPSNLKWLPDLPLSDYKEVYISYVFLGSKYLTVLSKKRKKEESKHWYAPTFWMLNSHEVIRICHGQVIF